VELIKWLNIIWRELFKLKNNNNANNMHRNLKEPIH